MLVSQYEADKSRLAGEITELKRDIGDREAQTSSFESRITQRNAQLIELQEEINRKCSEISNLEREVSLLFRTRNTHLIVLLHVLYCKWWNLCCGFNFAMFAVKDFLVKLKQQLSFCNCDIIIRFEFCENKSKPPQLDQYKKNCEFLALWNLNYLEYIVKLSMLLYM
jgi:hypothetical protein